MSKCQFIEELLSADLKYKNKINEFTGKRGDILFIDTSKCLHMGSRCRKIRFQLFITYTPILTYDINTLKSLNTFKQCKKVGIRGIVLKHKKQCKKVNMYNSWQKQTEYKKPTRKVMI